MRNRSVVNVLAVIFFISATLWIPDAVGQEFGPVTFTCPPCGCSGDSLTTAHAGSCPGCGMALMERTPLRNVAFLIFDNMQLADLAGAYSVFEAARTFDLYTVAAKAETIDTYLSPISILPKYTFDSAPPPDILVIPGGGVGRVVRNEEVIRWIQETSKQASLVLSVCTGAFILVKTGLLDGLSATVLEADIEQLKRAAPNVTVVSGRRFVDNGKFLSAAGPTSGIDASLHILTRVFGNDIQAKAIAQYLDYPWQPEEQ